MGAKTVLILRSRAERGVSKDTPRWFKQQRDERVRPGPADPGAAGGGGGAVRVVGAAAGGAMAAAVPSRGDSCLCRGGESGGARGHPVVDWAGLNCTAGDYASGANTLTMMVDFRRSSIRM